MGFFEKLKTGLFKTKSSAFSGIISIFKRGVSEDTLEELEEMLICADVGFESTEIIMEKLREKIKEEKIKESEDATAALKAILLEMIGEKEEMKLDTKPSVILVIGVNGVGKTTSIAKLAHLYKSQGKSVLLAAGDTFRAGAIEQLSIWADRAGVQIIKQSEGSDPAAVRDAGRTGQVLELMGKENIRLIVNRINPKLVSTMDLTVDDVMDNAGLPLIGIVPEDANVVLSAAFGKPLLTYTKKGAAAACRRIAKRIQGMPVKIDIR